MSLYWSNKKFPWPDRLSLKGFKRFCQQIRRQVFGVRTTALEHLIVLLGFSVLGQNARGQNGTDKNGTDKMVSIELSINQAIQLPLTI